MSRVTAVAALLMVGLLTFYQAAGDSYAPSPSCYEPSRPYRGADEWQWRSFKTDVAEYKSCIEDFVDEQEEEAQNHMDAAEEAIDEWNNFVDRELG